MRYALVFTDIDMKTYFIYYGGIIWGQTTSLKNIRYMKKVLLKHYDKNKKIVVIHED